MSWHHSLEKLLSIITEVDECRMSLPIGLETNLSLTDHVALLGEGADKYLVVLWRITRLKGKGREWYRQEKLAGDVMPSQAGRPWLQRRVCLSGQCDRWRWLDTGRWRSPKSSIWLGISGKPDQANNWVCHFATLCRESFKGEGSGTARLMISPSSLLLMAESLAKARKGKESLPVHSSRVQNLETVDHIPGTKQSGESLSWPFSPHQATQGLDTPPPPR